MPTDSRHEFQHAVKHIEADLKDDDLTLRRLHADIHDLRTEETIDGKLHKHAFKQVLARLDEKLHENGYLPHFDIVLNDHGHVRLESIDNHAHDPNHDRDHLDNHRHLLTSDPFPTGPEPLIRPEPSIGREPSPEPPTGPERPQAPEPPGSPSS